MRSIRINERIVEHDVVDPAESLLQNDAEDVVRYEDSFTSG
jgi:hypothetical protein